MVRGARGASLRRAFSAGAGVSLSDRLADRHNNFDLLRLLTAWAVLVSHSFAVVGRDEPLHQFNTTLGSTGVLVFFAVSGLLIRRSWEYDPTPRVFWTKRYLRLWPALTLVTVATALVLGPVVSKVPLRTYFSSWETWTYPMWIVLMTPFGAELPGVFTDLPQPRAINGPLWSLPVEVFAYLLLFLLGVTGLLAKRTLVTAVALVALGVAAWTVTPTQPTLGAGNALAAFALGACAYSWRDRVVLSHLGAALALASCVAAGSGPDALRVVVWTVGGGYLSFWFAYSLPPIAAGLTKWGDASYGLYICAFPIQQTLVQVLGPDTPPWVITVAATVVVWPLAIASWRLVERPALASKPHSLKVTVPLAVDRQRAEPAFQSATDRFQSP